MKSKKRVSSWHSEEKTDCACAMTAGSYEVEGHIGANFSLIFGDRIQQAGEIL